MITVRFPNGHFVTYNNATYVWYGDQFARLYVKKDGDWVADILLSGGPIIENIRPCKTGNAAQAFGIDDAAQLILDDPHQLSYGLAKKLKESLAKFNRQTGNWRD